MQSATPITKKYHLYFQDLCSTEARAKATAIACNKQNTFRHVTKLFTSCGCTHMACSTSPTRKPRGWILPPTYYLLLRADSSASEGKNTPRQDCHGDGNAIHLFKPRGSWPKPGVLPWLCSIPETLQGPFNDAALKQERFLYRRTLYTLRLPEGFLPSHPS